MAEQQLNKKCRRHRYDKQQPLIAFVYDNDEMSVPTLDDFINSQTDFLSKNDYVYYVAFEFCK